MPLDNHETIAVLAIMLVLLLAVFVISVSVMVVINDPGSPRPAPARSLEERDRQYRAEDEASRMLPPIGGAFGRSSEVPRRLPSQEP